MLTEKVDLLLVAEVGSNGLEARVFGTCNLFVGSEPQTTSSTTVVHFQQLGVNTYLESYNWGFPLSSASKHVAPMASSIYYLLQERSCVQDTSVEAVMHVVGMSTIFSND